MKLKIARNLLTLVCLTVSSPYFVTGQTPPPAKQVNLSVSLSCRSSVCPSNLEPSDFALQLDKEPQTISNFSDPSVPMSLMIVLDLTGSMKNHELYRKPEILKEALAAFFNELKQPNEYSLAVFGNELRVLQGWTPNAKAAWQALGQVFQSEPSGSMDVQEVCRQAIETLEKRKNEKRVLLLITGTEELALSPKDEERFRPKLQDSNIIICGIHMRELKGRFDLSMMNAIGPQIQLDKLASLSGGRVWHPQNKEYFLQSFLCAATKLNCLYVIGFNPSAIVQRGKKYPIKIAVKASPNSKRNADVVNWDYRELYVSPEAP